MLKFIKVFVKLLENLQLELPLPSSSHEGLGLKNKGKLPRENKVLVMATVFLKMFYVSCRAACCMCVYGAGSLMVRQPMS